MATPVPGAHSGQATDATQQASGVGSGRVGAVGIVIMAGLLLATAAVMFYVLVQVWPLAPEDTVVTSPTTTTQAGGESTVTVQRTFPDPEVQLFGANLTMSRETRLFLIVVTTGALGGSIHALRSLYWYVGNRNLVRSWLLMYVLLPYVGALLALVLYLVIRGGLLTVGGDTSDSLSAYGLAALGGLAGLYSEQAAAKLREVFGTLLAPAERGSDHVPSNPPEIEGFSPPRGAVGDDVVITGSGLASTSTVDFGGGATTPTVLSDTEVTAKVPANAKSGPIRLVTPAGTATSSAPFTVEAEPPAPPPPAPPPAAPPAARGKKP